MQCIVRRGLIPAVCLLFPLAALPAGAQEATLENGLRKARNWANASTFVAACIERKLLGVEHARYAAFAQYISGTIVGSLTLSGDAAQKLLAPYLQEGLRGRVHEFDASGQFAGHDLPFTEEVCGAVSGSLKQRFDLFSNAVLK